MFLGHDPHQQFQLQFPDCRRVVRSAFAKAMADEMDRDGNLKSRTVVPEMTDVVL